MRLLYIVDALSDAQEHSLGNFQSRFCRERRSKTETSSDRYLFLKLDLALEKFLH